VVSSQADASAGAPGADAEVAGGRETIVRVEDDGKAFDVAQGGAVTFKLARNAGTGFAWALKTVNSAVLARQGEPTSEGSSETPGAPRFEVLRFAARSPGTTAVEFVLQRAFGTAPARSMRVTVIVH
jgi:predicted secreted protein